MTLMGVFFLLFTAVFTYEIFHLIVVVESPVLLSILLGVALIASIYSIYNAGQLVTKEYTIPLKGITESVRLVHLSDVHIGTVHQNKFLKRVVDMTNSLNPNLVLMTGDLFDGSAPIHENMLRSLDSLSAPCFFSTGNHEEYEGLKKVKETISHLKMELLDNKFKEWNGLQIIGVDDKYSLGGKTLENILDTLSFNKEKPAILMYHTPVEWDMARKRGIDLMLSGHTHNGQIFPFTILVRFSFKYIRGLYKEASQYLHVTPGTGTWGPPMRLGSQNQITLLKLVPSTAA